MTSRIPQITTVDKWAAPLRADASAELFEACSSLEELCRLSAHVLYRKMGAPCYDHDIQTSDNDWWVPTDPRYILLREINELGLVTLDAEEGDLTDEPDIGAYWSQFSSMKYRACLVFLIHKTHFDRFVDEMKDCGFTIVVTRQGPFQEETSMPLVVFSDKNGNERVNSSAPMYSVEGDEVFYTGQSWTEDSFFNDEVIQLISEECFEVTVVDCSWNVPPHSEDGLFTKIHSFMMRLHGY